MSWESRSAQQHLTPNGKTQLKDTYRRVGAIMLNQSTIPAEGWGHAFDLEAATVNCTPNSLTGNDAPHYLITGKRPDVSRLFKHPFGQLLSCYDSEQKSFATGVLAISLNWEWEQETEQ